LSLLAYSNWRISAGSGAAIVAWWIMQTWLLHSLGLGWSYSAVDASVSTICLTLSCFIATIIYSYYQPGQSNRIHRLLFAIIITAAAGIACRQFLLFVYDDASYVSFLDHSMPVRYVIGFMAVAFVTVLNWLMGSLKAQQKQAERRSETEALMKEAELSGLRQQLQPHFIFNSLNSISALITVQPAEAQSMVQKLSDFLRGTLRQETRQLITLSEELAHLSLYLEIEKIRLGHRLKVKI
jgi:two-component system, LytTR family, sensor kinase